MELLFLLIFIISAKQTNKEIAYNNNEAEIEQFLSRTRNYRVRKLDKVVEKMKKIIAWEKKDSF
jgi:hypothetical protein